MAMKIPKMGLQTMLKEGHKVYEEAVYRNIQASKEMTEITRTSLGPNGKNKLIINHLQKLFVTNDTATILREMEVINPSAKLIVLAAQQQEVEVGDGSNTVMILAGSLLEKAEELLRMGLNQTEIVEGYEIALEKTLSILEESIALTFDDLTNVEESKKIISSVLASKQFGYEEFLSGLVVEAAQLAMPKVPKNFNVDNIRVVKIMGGGLLDSKVVKGMVFGREPEGNVKVAKGPAKIAVFSCPIDIGRTETKGTVLIKNKEEMLNFSHEEEGMLKQEIENLASKGVNVVVSGGQISDIAIHFLNKYNILACKVLSKFDIRRLCKAVGATPLARFGAPTPEEMGTCDKVGVTEVGGDRVTVFENENEGSSLATILIRGATKNMMDDVERAVDDGVNAFRSICRDQRLFPGGGAVEIELSSKLQSFAEKRPGLDQYAIRKFGEAFEAIPKTLAENAGQDPTVVLANLYAAHSAGKSSFGIDVTTESDEVTDMVAANVYDVFLTKKWAIVYAVHAAQTVLRVDQIIMAKPAGGPKVKENKNWDED